MTVDGVDVLLPTNDAEWATRLKRSRQALTAWGWEAGLPWADRELMRTIAETEIAALNHYIAHMPVKLRADVASLTHDWDALRVALLGR